MGAGPCWPKEHSDELAACFANNFTYNEVAEILSAKFGVTYSRCACIGRARRMGFTRGRPTALLTKQDYDLQRNAKKKAKRWAENPSLKDRAERLKILAENRKIFSERGATKTSAGYRKQFPKMPEMTKGELRAMLADAIRNTAAMGVS